MASEIEVFATTGIPAGDRVINRLYGQMIKAAARGDVAGLGGGIDSIDRLIDQLRFVRHEAGARTYELLPDQTYRYRGEEKTRKGMWATGLMMIEPYLVGGGWHRFDYPRVIKAVMQKAFGLDSRIVTVDGEVVGTVEQLVALVCECVSFSGVKSNAEKGTGLAAWDLERSDFGEHDDPRRDVKVHRSTTGGTS